MSSRIINLVGNARRQITTERLALACALAALLAIFGRESISYVTTATRLFKNRVRSNVPLEFELERARTMIGDMLPDIRRNMIVIAEEEVGVEQLREEVRQAEAALQHQREDVMQLRNDIENHTGDFKVGIRDATPKEVREELSRRFNRYQTAEAAVEAKRQLLLARDDSLAAARQKLESMLNAKRDLEVEVENLEARLQTHKNQPVAKNIQFDDTQIARCQQLVDELRVRLNVADRLFTARGADLDAIVQTSFVPAHEDIESQIDSYFASLK